MKKLISFFILIVLTVYLFYNFDFKKIDASLLNVKWIFVAIFFMILNKIILAFRWSEIGKIDFKISYETIVVSEFLNSIFPAKLGEISKLLYPKKFYGISLHNGTANLFVERFFDIILLAILMILFFYFYLQNDTIKAGLRVLSFFIIGTVIFFRFGFFYDVLERIPFKFFRIYAKKIYKSINKNLKNPYKVLLLTILLWISYFLTNCIFFIYGVDLNLDLSKSLEIFLFSTIALSVSVTPGGIATFEAVIVFILAKFGIDKEDAFIVAFIYHMLLFLVDFIMFELLLLVKNLDFKDIKNIKGHL